MSSLLFRDNMTSSQNELQSGSRLQNATGKQAVTTNGALSRANLAGVGNSTSNGSSQAAPAAPAGSFRKKSENTLSAKSAKETTYILTKPKENIDTSKNGKQSNVIGGDVSHDDGSVSSSKSGEHIKKCGSKVLKNIRKAKFFPKRLKPKPPPIRTLPPAPITKSVNEYTTNDNLRLVCRIRPTTYFNQEKIILHEDNQVLQLVQRDKLHPESNLSWKFRTDRSFYGGTQQQLFEETLQNPLLKALEGISSLVLLYGRKNTGKTFTSRGEDTSYEYRGMIPRGLQQIFKEIHALEHEYDIRVSVSYYDLVGETILDFLGEKIIRDMTVKDYLNVSYIRELGFARIANEEEGLLAYYLGNYNRERLSEMYVGKLYEYHTMFNFYFEIHSKLLTEEVFKVSKVTVLELGNFTNLKQVPYVSRETHDILLAINKSHASLEQAITMRIGGYYRLSELPCRGSKLVHSLKDILRNNSTMFVVIICISGEEDQIRNSIASLEFGTRFKGLNVKPTPNTIFDVNGLMRNLTGQVNMLKMELRMYDILNARDPPEYVPQPGTQDIFRTAKEVKDFVEGRISIPKFPTYKHLENFLNLLKKLSKDGDLPTEPTDQPDPNLAIHDHQPLTAVETDDGKASPAKDFTDADGTGDLDEKEGVGIGNAPGGAKGKGIKSLMKKKKEEKSTKGEKVSVTPKKYAPTKKGLKEQSSSPSVKEASLQHTNEEVKVVKIDDVEVNAPAGKTDNQAASVAPGITIPAVHLHAITRHVPKDEAYSLFVTTAPNGIELFKNTNKQRQIVVSQEKAATALSQAVNNWIDELQVEQKLLENLMQDRSRVCTYTTGEVPIISFDEYKAANNVKHLRYLIETGHSDLITCKTDLSYARETLAQARKNLYMEFETWYAKTYDEHPATGNLIPRSSGSGHRDTVQSADVPVVQPLTLGTVARTGKDEPTRLDGQTQERADLKVPEKYPPRDALERHAREFEEYSEQNPEAAIFYRVRKKVDQVRQIREYALAFNKLQPKEINRACVPKTELFDLVTELPTALGQRRPIEMSIKN